jgi:hypothetical protein
MAQIFQRSANTLSRVTIFGFLFVVLGLLVFAYLLARSPYRTQEDVVRDQPIPFSHEHHVGGLGIDCRYCHTSVETSANAGMPPTYTCMSCHSQIWNQAPMLAPVRESLAQNKPIAWSRVHDLPDFVYFHHGIHVQKGVSCVECHGRVDKMPLTWKAEPMTMEWCLDCHRHPENRLRTPGEGLFNLTTPALPEAEGRSLVNSLNIPLDRLTNCSVCHR